MSERAKPDERAYADLLAEAVKMDLSAPEALAYADHMRGTFHFELLTLGHAMDDLLAQVSHPVKWLVDRVSRRNLHKGWRAN